MLRINPERQKQFLAEKKRIVAQMERDFRRNDTLLSGLERYCGRKAKLYDSEKPDPYRSDRIWSGLEGQIIPKHDRHDHSPYALSYHDFYNNHWREHYIFVDKIRSMRIKQGVIVIDTQWIHGGSVPRRY